MVAHVQCGVRAKRRRMRQSLRRHLIGDGNRLAKCHAILCRSIGCLLGLGETAERSVPAVNTIVILVAVRRNPKSHADRAFV